MPSNIETDLVPSEPPRIAEWDSAITSSVATAVHGILEPSTPEERISEILATASGLISQTPEGMFIDTDRLTDSTAFSRFLDRVYRYSETPQSAGFSFYLEGIDVSVIEELLFEDGFGKRMGKVRFATKIRTVPDDRKSLYRGVTMRKLRDGTTMEAQYLFEKLYVDMPVEPEMEWAPTSVETQIYLDYDEFVAHLWQAGIRFGIREKDIREWISSGATGIQYVALGRERKPGTDASFAEEKKNMRRNLAPKELKNGTFDFAQFSVSFPEVRKGERILKKVPRAFGTPGFDIEGTRIDPAVPKDLNVGVFAGVGTSAVKVGEDEYIVADMDGFLAIDQKNKQVSVSAVIRQTEGVAHNTTGNLHDLVAVMEIEWGVEEGRILDGKGFTIVGDVGAQLVRASDFDITIRGSARNGKLEALEGNILLDGWRLSAEIVSAPKGHVEIHGNVESGSVIYAKRVVVHGTVYNSLIVADEVEVECAISSEILGKRISVGRTESKRGRENVVLLEIPLEPQERARYGVLVSEIETEKNKVVKMQTELSALQKQVPVPIEKMVEFLNRIAAIKAKSEVVSESDRIQFRAVYPYIETIRKYATIVKDVVHCDSIIFAHEEELRILREAYQSEWANVSLSISRVSGETRAVLVKFDPTRSAVIDFPKKLWTVQTLVGMDSKLGIQKTLCTQYEGSLEWKMDSSILSGQK